MIDTRLKDASDTAFRDRIRAMHANQTPLLDMVQQLGLAQQMSPQVRAVVAGLDKNQVAAIRQATIDMLDRNGDELPVDCAVTQAEIDRGTPVSVSIESKTAGSTIVVRATST